MQHTPGPWEFVPGEDNEDDCSNSIGAIKGDGEHIARVWADGPNPRADAILMVAAHDLLAALIAMMPMFESIIEGSYGPRMERVGEDARAAIAKATDLTEG